MDGSDRRPDGGGELGEHEPARRSSKHPFHLHDRLVRSESPSAAPVHHPSDL